MADLVAGKAAREVLHIMPDSAYILHNRDSAQLAKVVAPGEGRRVLLHDELRLLAVQASPLSGIGLEPVVPRLHIVAPDQHRLVTNGVRIEWVRVNPLN